MDQTLLTFLIISQCRMREHYQLKLRECLTVLGEEQLWQPIDATVECTIGGIIQHIIEHPRRHTEWMHTGSKAQNEPRFEDFFPISSESVPQMLERVDEIFNLWHSVMTSFIAEARLHGTLPVGGPDMGAIYHLVEHVSYHLGQVIAATERVTGHKFSFCQRGNNEWRLNEAVRSVVDHYERS